MNDSFLLGSTSPGIYVGIFAACIFFVIAVMQFWNLLTDHLFWAIFLVYLLFAIGWNFKLGLPYDLDLMLAPSLILMIVGLILSEKIPARFDQTQIKWLAAIGIVNSIISSAFTV